MLSIAQTESDPTIAINFNTMNFTVVLHNVVKPILIVQSGVDRNITSFVIMLHFKFK